MNNRRIIVNAQEKRQERTQLFQDLYSGIIPKRFPIFDAVGFEYLLQFAGKDLLTVNYSLTKEVFTEVYEKAQEMLGGDVFAGVLFGPRNATALMLAESKYLVMSKTGMLQHPEISAFEPEDYDEFIKNPYDFLVEHRAPRFQPAFEGSPARRALNYAKFVLASVEQNAAAGAAMNEVSAKYGYFAPPAGTVGSQTVPFDYIADNLRSFSKINFDLRRCPQKVLDAVEAMMPYVMNRALKSKPDVLGCNTIKTHMPTFLSQKDFDKFYWPTFNKACHINGEHGIYMDIFCEHDWDRYLDNLLDLPQGSRMYIEYGDPQAAKDKLGNKYVLGGFYPLVLLKSGTKQQCVDKAKELIDIMAPGGNFYFRFDKQAYRGTDINIENYKAVMEYLTENGKYDNAGQASMTGNREDTIVKYFDQYPKFESKYIVSFDEFKKSYPPADERAEPYMRAQYEKYTAQAEAFLV